MNRWLSKLWSRLQSLLKDVLDFGTPNTTEVCSSQAAGSCRQGFEPEHKNPVRQLWAFPAGHCISKGICKKCQREQSAKAVVSDEGCYTNQGGGRSVILKAKTKSTQGSYVLAERHGIPETMVLLLMLSFGHTSKAYRRLKCKLQRLLASSRTRTLGLRNCLVAPGLKMAKLHCSSHTPSNPQQGLNEAEPRDIRPYLGLVLGGGCMPAGSIGLSVSSAKPCLQKSPTRPLQSAPLLRPSSGPARRKVFPPLSPSKCSGPKGPSSCELRSLYPKEAWAPHG